MIRYKYGVDDKVEKLRKQFELDDLSLCKVRKSVGNIF